MATNYISFKHRIDNERADFVMMMMSNTFFSFLYNALIDAVYDASSYVHYIH